MKSILYTSVSFFMVSIIGLSQTSIKFAKPENIFWYSQLSLRGGAQYNLNNPSDPWLFSSSSKGQRTRLSNQVFFRSKKTLQKGYIRKVGIRSGMFAFSLDYDPFYSGTNGFGSLQFRLMDNWLSFGTKKSRRNFWVGNRRVEYGRSHRIEAETSFMNRNSLRVRDFGFWWDLGVVCRSPLIKNPENRWDVTLQLSSGGWLFSGNGQQGTLWFIGTDRVNDSTHFMQIFNPDLTYKNTFLAIANIGRPTYVTKELNFIAAIGNIRDQYNLDSTVIVSRLGVDHVLKKKESFKMGNQITIGNSFFQDGRSFFVLNMNNTIDYSLSKHYVVSLSQYFGFNQGINNPDQLIDYSFVSTVAYVFNPNLKLRLNFFYDNEDRWNNRHHIGTYVQLVAGIGRRT